MKQMGSSPLKSLVMHSADTTHRSAVVGRVGRPSGQRPARACSAVVCSVQGPLLPVSRRVPGVAWRAQGSAAGRGRNHCRPARDRGTARASRGLPQLASGAGGHHSLSCPLRTSLSYSGDSVTGAMAVLCRCWFSLMLVLKGLFQTDVYLAAHCRQA